MFTKLISAAAIAIVFVSCGSGDKKTEPTDAVKTTDAAMPQHDSTAAKADFTNIKFDAAKDFVCGMPVSAGVSDTAHYKEKIYGFCSKECKDDFAKNPEKYIAKQ